MSGQATKIFDIILWVIKNFKVHNFNKTMQELKKVKINSIWQPGIPNQSGRHFTKGSRWRSRLCFRQLVNQGLKWLLKWACQTGRPNRKWCDGSAATGRILPQDPFTPRLGAEMASWPRRKCFSPSSSSSNHKICSNKTILCEPMIKIGKRCRKVFDPYNIQRTHTIKRPLWTPIKILKTQMIRLMPWTLCWVARALRRCSRKIIWPWTRGCHHKQAWALRQINKTVY